MHRNLNNQHHRYARTFVLHWRTFTIFNLEVKINSTDLQQENNIAINQQHITVTMARVLFFLALLIATASAFVVPVQHAGMFDIMILSCARMFARTQVMAVPICFVFLC